ncbi:MAG: aconitase/3-isopropylmalate dehydratase large subunit family protein [Gaiellaceae bacterium]|jgi:3-isopropylmalate/(R)-2-methylmalate dehydratase large subunit
MAYTVAEKILLAHSDAEHVEPGQVVMVRCDVVLANDVTGPVSFRQMEKMGASEVFDRSKIVMVADHFAPAKDERSAILIKRLKDWSLAHGVVFYDQGRGGIEHTLLAQEGWIVPGSVIVGGDSHTCTHGALGAFSSGLGSTDIAYCLVFGEFWEAVPGTIQITVSGTKKRFVTGKDAILSVIGQIGAGGGTGNVLEFVGQGVQSLSIDERLAVSNLAVEAGSETGIFPADEITTAYLGGRTDRSWEPVHSDPDASYSRRITVDFDRLEPLVAKPHNPENVVPVREVAGTPIHQVVIGNCSNGTMTDLRQAAQMVQGRRVHERTRMIVVPATQKIYREALAEGLVDILVEAGAAFSTPTCGPCFGGHTGALAPGENSLATINRNFKGRSGSPDARVYLGNAFVAAAAAVAGEIVNPAEVAS